jgi:hypothetical protein
VEALPPSPLYPSRGQVIRRRLIALAVVVILGLAVALLAFGVDLPLVGGGGDGEKLGEPPALTEATTVKEDGLTVGWPSDWSQTKTGGVGGPLRLTSEDKTTTVALAAPAEIKAARGRQIVLDDSLKAIRKNYRKVRVTQVKQPQQVNGYPSVQAVVSARNKSGVPIRILITVAWKKKLVYVVEVFQAANAPPQRLVEAQTILDSLKLTK